MLANPSMQGESWNTGWNPFSHPRVPSSEICCLFPFVAVCLSVPSSGPVWTRVMVEHVSTGARQDVPPFRQPTYRSQVSLCLPTLAAAAGAGKEGQD